MSESVKGAIIGALIAAVVSILGSFGVYAITFGQIVEKVESLDIEVTKISSQVASLKNPPSTQAVICTNLYNSLQEAIARGSISAKSDLRQEISELDCGMVLQREQKMRL